MPKKMIVLLLFVVVSLYACSSGKPPDSLFYDDVEKMVLLDQEIGFKEEIVRIEIVNRKVHNKQVEVEVRISGWNSHPELGIGAALPATPEQREAWAKWKYFIRKKGGNWVIENRFKVDEGFLE